MKRFFKIALFLCLSILMAVILNLAIREIKVRCSFSSANQIILGRAILKEDLGAIVKYKSNINETFNIKTSPLLFAIINKKPKSFKCLIENGANIDLIIDNKSAMKIASEYKNLYYLQLCIENGGDLNLLHKFGNRPLSFALDAENYEGVKLLLKSGADANLSDKFNNTCFVNLFALHECDKILFLLNNGVNPMLSNDTIKLDIVHSVETLFTARDMSNERYKNLPLVIKKLEDLGFKFKLQSLDEKLKEEELKGNYKSH